MISGPGAADNGEPPIESRVARGFAITLVAQGGRTVLSFGTAVILARLLGPEDYGLAGMVTAVTGLLFVFNDVGLSSKTIQKKDLTDEETTGVFWLQLLVSLAVAALTVPLGPLLAWVYDEPRVITITWALAPTFICIGLYGQHQALLRRHMRYSAVAAVDLLSVIASAAVAVGAAFLGLKYWSLVLQTVTLFAVQLPAYWLLSRWRPGRPHIGPSVREHVSFSIDFFAYRVLDYVSRAADKALLGAHFGARPLGLYERATSILALPMSQIKMPLSHVLLPALSQTQDQPERFRNLYLSNLTLLAWLTLPLSGALVACAADVVLVVLGPRWGDATRIFLYASVGAALMPLATTRGWIFMALSRTRQMLRFGLFASVPLLVLIVLTAPKGPEAVAMARSGWAAVLLVAGLWDATRDTAIELRHVVKAIWPPLLASVGIGAFANRLAPLCDSPIARLAAAACLSALIAALLLVVSGQVHQLRTGLDLLLRRG